MPTPNRSLDLTYLGSPSTSTPAPSTPAEHSYGAAESGLAELRGVGFDDGGRTVDVLVALTHATLAIRRELTTNAGRSAPKQVNPALWADCSRSASTGPMSPVAVKNADWLGLGQ